MLDSINECVLFSLVTATQDIGLSVLVEPQFVRRIGLDKSVGLQVFPQLSGFFGMQRMGVYQRVVVIFRCGLGRRQRTPCGQAKKAEKNARCKHYWGSEDADLPSDNSNSPSNASSFIARFNERLNHATPR